MKIEQKPQYQQIVITLETAQDAESFWKMVRAADGAKMDAQTTRYAIMISNWFSERGQLGAQRLN